MINNADQYEIYWDNGQKGPVNDRLIAGLYNVTLYDINQCKVERSYIISEPDKLVFTDENINKSYLKLCYNDSIAINNNVIGGTPPYTLLFNENHISESYILSETGNYIFIAYDANLCSVNRQVTVNELNDIPIEFLIDTFENKIYLTCLALYDNHGIWLTGENTPTIEVYQSGEYAVEIIGEYNCVYSKSINVSILSSEIDIAKLSITLFPNPADNYLNIKCNSCNLNESAVEIRSIDGLLCLKSPYQFNQELDISHLNPGIYTVSLNIANFIVHKKLIVLK
ncbi:MAG: T9SS type A sorting domain-containing protein [Saprospiraceae bacterium]|nr:T9SS type A sorting domain-containing protein [Saprospiraceae bacterium]